MQHVFPSNRTTDAIDLTVKIQTPENIEFEYQLAGPFLRLIAWMLDVVIRNVILAVCYIIVLIAVGNFQSIFGAFGADLSNLLISVMVFLFQWFYGTLFESFWNGQTPGKWLLRIRVISVDGRPINLYQATVRNMLRSADVAPLLSLEMFHEDAPPVYIIPTYLVGFLFMVVTRRFQRLGDLAAGTMVVISERSWTPVQVKLEDPRTVTLAEFIPAHFKLSATLSRAIALYMERRHRMSIARRQELASLIAAPLLDQFGFRSDTSADLLLCAIYYREFVAKNAFAKDSDQSGRSRSTFANRSPLNSSLSPEPPTAMGSVFRSSPRSPDPSSDSNGRVAVESATATNLNLTAETESSTIANASSSIPPVIDSSAVPP